MKHCLSVFFLSAALLPSCSKDGFSSFDPVRVDDSELLHGEIILGDQLDNPYSIENVKSALRRLYPTKAVGDIVSTDYYVRFLPSDDAQLSELLQSGITLVDHPVDYTIVQDGDYYHDPSVSSDKITWQYAVVPLEYEFPEGIRYEILQNCFLSDHASSTKAMAGVDWDAVEQEAFRLTGNETMISPATKGSGKVQPSGRITIVDPEVNAGQPVGLSGVKVVCNVFVNFSSTYTDRDGYYTIPKKFTANLRYRLMFQNMKGFTIGFNAILVPASVSTLGRNSPQGIDFTVDSSSERKLFCRSVVNNAAFDFYERCAPQDLSLTPPASDICFWLFNSMSSSSAVMLHHGTVLDSDSSNKIFAAFSSIVKFFSPDITIGTSGKTVYKEIYAAVVHELSHAGHFALVGKNYWDKYIGYIVRCNIAGEDMYGTGSLSGAGYCAVGEMWAYFMQNKMYMERYGCENPAFGSGYWFHPQILTYLEERGLSAKQIMAALAYDGVSSKETLQERLLDLYPDKMTEINQVFNRYD